MNFCDALKSSTMISRTENGMATLATSDSSLVDFFFKAGASRGKDLTELFSKAFYEDPLLATKLLFWARDIRGGAGEREVFRKILRSFETAAVQTENGLRVMQGIIDLIPFYGRWDDLLIFTDSRVKEMAFRRIATGFQNPNEVGLVAKWMPRKGPVAAELTHFFSTTPRIWRKYLVQNTNVVEQKMCAKQWDEIEFGKIPSLAASRYNKAFNRHVPGEYQRYIEGLKKGTEKVNTGAVYPYDVIKALRVGYGVNKEFIVEQWKALPNFVGDARTLPVVDVSGSMTWTPVSPNLYPLDIAVSLGLYLSEKNTGPFKDVFITFSDRPEIQHLTGNVVERYNTMTHSNVGGSTNLHATFEKILSVATRFHVPQSEMPETVLILSDMEFNQCARYDDRAFDMIKRKYKEAGYEVPKIVFWNIQARNDKNVPVRCNEKGVALVSGFSPAIMKSIMSAQDFTPFGVMMQAIGSDRYSPVESVFTSFRA